MNERIDHTRHEHANTAAARRSCRKAIADLVRTAREAYVVREQDGCDTDEYCALVAQVAVALGCGLVAAYEIVEDGKVY